MAMTKVVCIALVVSAAQQKETMEILEFLVEGHSIGTIFVDPFAVERLYSWTFA